MKFKVGNKVRFVKSTIFHTDKVKIGETYKIIKIAGSDVRNQVENKEWFKEEELERVDYTYEDLKKSPIGTKIAFENGKVYTRVNLINGSDCFTDSEGYRSVEDLKGLKDNWSSRILGKIIKIEEPQYTTVYEAKKEILDEAEKRYLRQVIRPYKDVISIQKYIFIDNILAKIVISVPDIRGRSLWSIDLPPFEKNTMYKNMEDNKEYTLEELDL